MFSLHFVLWGCFGAATILMAAINTLGRQLLLEGGDYSRHLIEEIQYLQLELLSNLATSCKELKCTLLEQSRTLIFGHDYTCPHAKQTTIVIYRSNRKDLG